MAFPTASVRDNRSITLAFRTTLAYWVASGDAGRRFNSFNNVA